MNNALPDLIPTADVGHKPQAAAEGSISANPIPLKQLQVEQSKKEAHEVTSAYLFNCLPVNQGTGVSHPHSHRRGDELMPGREIRPEIFTVSIFRTLNATVETLACCCCCKSRSRNGACNKVRALTFPLLRNTAAPLLDSFPALPRASTVKMLMDTAPWIFNAHFLVSPPLAK